MENEMRTRPRAVKLAAAVLTGVALTSACAADTGTANPGGKAGSADVADLRAKIEQWSAVPKFQAPGSPIGTAALQGKTVMNIPDSSGNPFAAGVAASEQKAAESVGVNFINCENQGQLTEWISCFNQATQRKVDVINDFGGVDPRQLGPQIDAAQMAGIQVVAQNVYGFDQQPINSMKSVPTPYETGGGLLGDWVSLDTNRDADVLLLVSNEVIATESMVKGFKASFAKECPDCKVTVVNVPVKDWSTKIQSEVQSAMVRDPKLNYVVPIYDPMTQFVVPAITAGGKTGQVHVATFAGTPFVLKYIQDGDIVRMDIGENLDWIGYAFLDADLRLLAGEDVPTIMDQKTPLRIFTKDNIDEAGTPPTATGGYGEEYVTGFENLWGVAQ
jgi:ribose transport system substrate-binding protein